MLCYTKDCDKVLSQRRISYIENPPSLNFGIDSQREQYAGWKSCMAGSARNPRTLNRRNDEVRLDEVERIGI